MRACLFIVTLKPLPMEMDFCIAYWHVLQPGFIHASAVVPVVVFQ